MIEKGRPNAAKKPARPKPAPKKTPAKPKPQQFWLVSWRAPGEEQWQVVRHYLGPFSEGVPRRFVSRVGSAGCVEDLIAAGLEAKVEPLEPSA